MHPWFRLLLIHYPDGPVPSRWERELWAEDRTRAEDLTQEDVADVLRKWADGHGKQIPEADVLDLAAEVVARADGDAARLRRIHDELAATLDGLGGSA